MATTADSYSVRRAQTRASISTHPAFPAIVALWFAALLGIGSLVLPVALFERLVTVTGLASLIPSAAPPLGFTARAGIALAGAITGALIGLVLARKVAQSHAFEPTARPFGPDDVRRCRPISAHDELGEEGLGSERDASPVLTNKRRSLAMSEDNRRSAYLSAAPLPGLAADGPATFAPPAELPVSAAEPVEALVPEPLELGDFVDPASMHEFEDETPDGEPDAALDALRSRIHVPVEFLSSQDQPMTDRPSFDIPQAFEPADVAADALPFAPPSLRRAEPVAFEQVPPETDDESTFVQEPAPRLSVVDPFDQAEALDDDRPLDELGLVQLAARLGASLEKRKARLAGHAPTVRMAPVSPLAGAEDFEAAEPGDAARAIADFFGPARSSEPTQDEMEPAASIEPSFETTAPVVPASLRTLPFDIGDEADDDAFTASFSLPLSRAPVALEPVEDDDPDEAEDESDEDGDYSSLLAMKNPFVRQQEFVRVDEPEDETEAIEPTVTFPSPAPGQAAQDGAADLAPRPFDPPRNPSKSAIPAASRPGPRDPGDAERNLRAALATLQRMGGAA